MQAVGCVDDSDKAAAIAEYKRIGIAALTPPDKGSIIPPADVRILLNASMLVSLPFSTKTLPSPAQLLRRSSDATVCTAFLTAVADATMLNRENKLLLMRCIPLIITSLIAYKTVAGIQVCVTYLPLQSEQSHSLVFATSSPPFSGRFRMSLLSLTVQPLLEVVHPCAP